MPQSFGGVLVAVLIAVLSGVVMSGIPGGGLIGEMLIVSLYGFPTSAFTMIATIGWIVDAPATMMNVCGDIPSTMLIEKWVNRKKKEKKVKNGKETPPKELPPPELPPKDEKPELPPDENSAETAIQEDIKEEKP